MAKTPKKPIKSEDEFSPYGEGFEEAGQAPFEGTPVNLDKVGISDWAEEISKATDDPFAKPAPGSAETVKRTARYSGKERARAGGDESISVGQDESRKARLSPKGAKAKGEFGLSSRVKKPDLDDMGPGTDKQVPAKETKKPKKPKALKTARGTSMGGPATAKERAAGGLNPVAGLDVTLEEAEKSGKRGQG